MENKKKLSKGTKILLIIAGILVGLAVIMALTVLVLHEIGKNALTDDGSGMRMQSATVDSDEGTVKYKDKLYRYNDRITTILLMGVDAREKNVTEGEFGQPNQTDANVLAVLDPVNEKVTLISVSRDTMCTIDVIDDKGEHTGTAQAQLALAHSFGDGGNVSCELTTSAVSRIFYGLPIKAYGSIYLDGIIELVDVVDGVTVTPATSFSVFTEGKPVLLKGWLTEQYVRYREHTVEGNNERMQRQNQVLKELVKTALERAKSDKNYVLSIYDSVKDNATTNLDASMIVYLAMVASNLSFDGSIINVPGESVMGAQNHAEFYVDEDALFELILDVFYIPVETE